MKRILFFVLFIASICLKAQTTFWTEGFGTGCNQLQLANGLNPGGNGTWTVSILGAEDPQANTWYVSATENGNAVGACGTGCGTNQTLHVASIPNGSGLTVCPSGDCGASYDAGGTGSFGGTSTGTNKRIESPVINCIGHSTITLSFKYMENGQGTTDDASLWYFDGTIWSQINALAKTVTCSSGQGTWTTFSMALPVSADNNVGVKIGFLWVNNDDGVGTDPSFAVDDVTLTDAVTAATPVVTITPSPTTAICQNATLTLNGSATNGPITAWAWMVSPKAGVVFSPDTTAQNPTVTFTTSGIYTFTLQATNASGSGTSTQTISVLPSVTPSVAIAANPVNPICAGQAVSFTATPTNGGTTPIYQWQVNGVNAGTNSPNFSSSILINNDIVSVTYTSNATCASPITDNATYVVQLAAPVTPSVSISVSPSATVCLGSMVTFSANTSGGGTSPSFQWVTNGINSGTNSSTFTLTPANNDQVHVVMTSNATCASPLTANSNTVMITVLAGGSLTAGATKTICSGDSTKLSSNGTNWVWSPSAGLSCISCQNPKASPAATTVYTVTGLSGSCTSSATETVIVNQSPTALFVTSGTVQGVPQTVNFINGSNNATGYVWNFGDNSGTVVADNVSHMYNATGVYTVTLIAYGGNGCNDTISSIFIVTDTSGITMPNVFTPNGDGINDYFLPNTHGLKTLDCTIYDRWGAKITDLDTSTQQYWDGHTTSGLACSEGTYFYTLKATDVNGKSYSLKGFIQLIR